MVDINYNLILVLVSVLLLPRMIYISVKLARYGWLRAGLLFERDKKKEEEMKGKK